MAAAGDTETTSSALNEGVSPDTTNETAATSTTTSSHKEYSAEQQADETQPDTIKPNDDHAKPNSLRRSLRQSSWSTRQSTQMPSTSETQKKRLDPSKIMSEPSRRNPKRKASESTRLLEGLPEDLLSEALRPLEPKEIEEWKGWVELESEPVRPHDLTRVSSPGS